MQDIIVMLGCLWTYLCVLVFIILKSIKENLENTEMSLEEKYNQQLPRNIFY